MQAQNKHEYSDYNPVIFKYTPEIGHLKNRATVLRFTPNLDLFLSGLILYLN